MLEIYSCSMVLEGYLGTYSQVLVEVGKLWRRIESMRGNFCVPVVAFIKLSIYKTNKKQMSGGGGVESYREHPGSFDEVCPLVCPLTRQNKF